MNNARNTIVTVTGRKGSGKSALLAWWASQFPRRLVLDFTGEHKGDVPAPLVAWGLAATVKLLRRLAGLERWHIVAQLEPGDVPRLLAHLMPMGAQQSPALAMGGLVIECGELNEIAPNHSGIRREVAAMFTRGRHHRVSVLGAARTATELHKITTSQADVICAFRQHQEADVKRIGELMGQRAIPAVRSLGPWEYLRFLVDTGQLHHVDRWGNLSPIAESV